MKEKILKLIENNAKLEISDISKLLSTDESSIKSAIAEMEADGIICGYNTIINWDKVSEELCQALIEVRVIPERGRGFDNIANRISKFPEVDSVYLISGGYDFLVQIKGRSMKSVSQFVFDKLATLDSVQSTATHFVLKKYKDHGVTLESISKEPREKIIL
ncbi:Lrp/AsnC family transcriptional regulator [bacterium]|nr:Lrp/AsnC family transcriptional regulator [bacterium]